MFVMNKQLPIYKAVLDNNEDGMFIVSFVDLPAVEVDWQAFAEEKQPMQFSIEDEDKHIVRGVLMRANHPIYRNNNGFEYYVEFEPDTLREMSQRFLKEGYNNNVDTMHNFELEDGVYLQEIFMKDIENGINPKGFEEVEDGSLFGQYKVENDDIWEKVKDGTFKGFSIVCVNAWKKIEQQFSNQEDKDYEEIVDMINKIKDKINKK